jgi:hypothetical protein
VLTSETTATTIPSEEFQVTHPPCAPAAETNDNDADSRSPRAKNSRLQADVYGFWVRRLQCDPSPRHRWPLEHQPETATSAAPNILAFFLHFLVGAGSWSTICPIDSLTADMPELSPLLEQGISSGVQATTSMAGNAAPRRQRTCTFLFSVLMETTMS